MQETMNHSNFTVVSTRAEDSTVASSCLLIGTIVLCIALNLIILPWMVSLRKVDGKKQLRNKRRKAVECAGEKDFTRKVDDKESGQFRSWVKRKKRKTPSLWQHSARNIISGIRKTMSHYWDEETRNILLSRALPSTVGQVASSTLSSVCLALVIHAVGTRGVTAYTLSTTLVGLTDGMLQAPLYAASTLCSQSVGAKNDFLTGQYVQMSFLLFVIPSIPCMLFWCCYMKEVLMFMHWTSDDVNTAVLAEQFIRQYVWYYLLQGMSNSLWHFLEVTNHVVEGTLMSISCGVLNVVAIFLLSVLKRQQGVAVTIFDIGNAYMTTSALFVVVTYALANHRGWLSPSLKRGLFSGLSSKTSPKLIRMILPQALPLSIDSIAQNAEWTCWTFMAGHIGSSSTAAWAILGSLWDISYQCTSSIGAASKVVVATHLGNDQGELARRCAFKAIVWSVLGAFCISMMCLGLASTLPTWYSADEEVQRLLSHSIRLMAVGNLAMQHGMTSWQILTAMGRYKLVTIVSNAARWGLAMPLAALFVCWWHFEMEWLTAAVVWSYVATGAALSFALLITDWDSVAKQVAKEACKV